MEEQNQQTSTQVASQPSRLLGAKELLKRSWQIYKARFIIFILISAVSLVAVPLSFVNPTAFLVFFPVFILWFFVVIFLGLWTATAMLYAIKDRNLKIGFKESFKRGLHKIWPSLGTNALVGLAVLGGLILLIAPGFIFAIWFAFASYLVVAENLSGKKALSRSKQLVKGSFWAVVGRSLVLGIIMIVISLILNSLFSFMFGKDIGSAISSIASIFIAPFTTIYMVLIYEELKKIKD